MLSGNRSKIHNANSESPVRVLKLLRDKSLLLICTRYPDAGFLCSNFFPTVFQHCYFLGDLFPSYIYILGVFHALTDGTLLLRTPRVEK